MVSKLVLPAVGGLDEHPISEQRVFGNGVTRTVHWAADGSLADALVTFYDAVVDTTVVVAHDEYVYEATGRTGAVVDHVDGTAMCYTYDAFNRLAAAFTNPLVSDVAGCDTAPATTVDDAWVVGDAPYASLWEYSPAGHMTTQTLFTHDSGVVSIDQQVFTYGDTDHPHAVTQVTGDATSSFDYDDAGRLVSRTTDTTDPATEMHLTWDGASNLIQTVQDGELHRFIYDASGQRVVRIAGDTATAYLGATELTDADVTTTSGVVGTRYITAGGVNLATITAPTTNPNGDVWLMFGDIQGSTTVAVTYTPDPADATVTRQYYAPYGTIRSGDITATERGWLNQTLDTTTGLTYLNARYYDTTTARFISPDPLLNPGDPRMLDAYMYANNNPIAYTDATGLCAWLTGAAYDGCMGARTDANNLGNKKNTSTTNTGGGSGGGGGGGSGGGGGGTSTADNILAAALELHLGANAAGSEIGGGIVHNLSWTGMKEQAAEFWHLSQGPGGVQGAVTYITVIEPVMSIWNSAGNAIDALGRGDYYEAGYSGAMATATSVMIVAAALPAGRFLKVPKVPKVQASQPAGPASSTGVGAAASHSRTATTSSSEVLQNPIALRGLTPSQIDDLAVNAGYIVRPGRASSANPATRYYVPGTNQSVGFRVLPQGVVGQTGIKAGPYLRFFGGPNHGLRVPLSAS